MTAQIFNFTDEKDWLEKRTHYVTSSEISLLFNINKYGKSKFSLWHEKMKPAMPDERDNKRMNFGKATEELIGKLFSIEYEYNIKPMKYFMYDDETRLGSSFDFEIIEGVKKDWIVECKNVDRHIYNSDWTDGEAPLHIEYQVQLQLLLTARPGCFIVAFVGGNELKIIERLPSHIMQKAILKKTYEFWKSVDLGLEPEPDLESADIDNVIRLYLNTDSGKAAELTPELAMLLEQYEIMKELQISSERTAKALKARIFYVVKDADHIDLGNSEFYNMTTTKNVSGTKVTNDMVGSVLGSRDGYRQLRRQKVKKGKTY